jgi:hypothetical protein
MWDVPQDWTIEDIDTLTLYVYVYDRRIYNDRDRLYVTLADRDGRNAVVVHSDPGVVPIKEWIKWTIPVGEFTGVNSAAVTTIYIGVGDRNKPQPGGEGMMYIDDIRLTRRTP